MISIGNFCRLCGKVRPEFRTRICRFLFTNTCRFIICPPTRTLSVVSIVQNDRIAGGPEFRLLMLVILLESQLMIRIALLDVVTLVLSVSVDLRVFSHWSSSSSLRSFRASHPSVFLYLNNIYWLNVFQTLTAQLVALSSFPVCLIGPCVLMSVNIILSLSDNKAESTASRFKTQHEQKTTVWYDKNICAKRKRVIKYARRERSYR